MSRNKGKTSSKPGESAQAHEWLQATLAQSEAAPEAAPVKSKRGGVRPGAGRKRKPPPGDPAAHTYMEYSQELAERICEEIALGGMLKRICEQPGYPNRSSVWRWRRSMPAFDQAYLAACEMKAEAWADEIVSIASDGTNDTQTDENGNTIVNHDIVRRSELRVNTLKWLMERFNKSVFGERKSLDVNVSSTLADDLEKARARELRLSATPLIEHDASK